VLIAAKMRKPKKGGGILHISIATWGGGKGREPIPLPLRLVWKVKEGAGFNLRGFWEKTALSDPHTSPTRGGSKKGRAALIFPGERRGSPVRPSVDPHV